MTHGRGSLMDAFEPMMPLGKKTKATMRLIFRQGFKSSQELWGTQLWILHHEVWLFLLQVFSPFHDWMTLLPGVHTQGSETKNLCGINTSVAEYWPGRWRMIKFTFCTACCDAFVSEEEKPWILEEKIYWAVKMMAGPLLYFTNR